MDEPVRAAGGVVWRGSPGSRSFAVLHRPHRQDWSLAKGKLEAGEEPLEAALREIREETGFEVDVGPELDTVRYVDHRGRPKVVHYWSMRWRAGDFAVNAEVDELRWLDADEAVGLLTYAVDRALIRRVADLP